MFLSLTRKAVLMLTGFFMISTQAHAAGGSADYLYAGASSSVPWADRAGYAYEAGHAQKADQAITASSATYAARAGEAVSAKTANYATNASQSQYANRAQLADRATRADYATQAGEAILARTANYAVAAGTAAYANRAGLADRALKADYATSAGSATYALNAQNLLPGASVTNTLPYKNGAIFKNGPSATYGSAGYFTNQANNGSAAKFQTFGNNAPAAIFESFNSKSPAAVFSADGSMNVAIQVSGKSILQDTSVLTLSLRDQVTSSPTAYSYAALNYGKGIVSLGRGDGLPVTLSIFGDLQAKNAQFSGKLTAQDLIVSGGLTASSATIANLSVNSLVAKDGNFSGKLTAQDLIASGSLTAKSASVSGLLSAGEINTHLIQSSGTLKINANALELYGKVVSYADTYFMTKVRASGLETSSLKVDSIGPLTGSGIGVAGDFSANNGTFRSVNAQDLGVVTAKVYRIESSNQNKMVFVNAEAHFQPSGYGTVALSVDRGLTRLEETEVRSNLNVGGSILASIVKSSTTIVLDAPAVQVTKNLNVGGAIVSSGTVSAQDFVLPNGRKMSELFVSTKTVTTASLLK